MWPRWRSFRGGLRSSDDESASLDEPVRVSITLAGLEAFHGIATGRELEGKCSSSFSENGMAPSRVKHALRSPSCNCKCSMPYQLLLKVCCAFWSLTKAAQDSILWSLQSAGDRHGKRYYDIEGWMWELLSLVKSIVYLFDEYSLQYLLWKPNGLSCLVDNVDIKNHYVTIGPTNDTTKKKL